MESRRNIEMLPRQHAMLSTCMLGQKSELIDYMFGGDWHSVVGVCISDGVFVVVWRRCWKPCLN